MALLMVFLINALIKVKLINHDCPPILTLCYIMLYIVLACLMLYIVLAYLMLFAALSIYPEQHCHGSIGSLDKQAY